MNRKLRPRHPNIGDNLSSIGALETQEAHYAEAVRLYRDALQEYSQTLEHLPIQRLRVVEFIVHVVVDLPR